MGGIGHTIFRLPPYSPDLNLIEKMRVWVKRLWKVWRLDCVDSLFFYLLWIDLVF
ncbi:transposase [Neisseria iguanae]|uniref:transposase n=1 Tax=Neisseria iguanae TaxID=90242 RepID=UPI003CCC1F66